MIRALVIVAVAGFLMAVGCISAAVAIGGPEAVQRSGWMWSWDGDERPSWGPWHRWHGWRSHEASGPQAQRDFPWSGGDKLEVNAPAEIEYIQAAGPAKFTISGPTALLNRVRVEGGRVSLLPGGHARNALHIRLSAPAVKRFELNGADRLKISGYKQDQLELNASGHAEITASGETKSVKLRVSGAGEADLSELKTAGAEIAISGAGQATVGPTEWARIDISGMGDVDLLTRPKQLETNISGAGRIQTPDADEDAGHDAAPDRGPKRTT
jgi:hypothetical protein